MENSKEDIFKELRIWLWKVRVEVKPMCVKMDGIQIKHPSTCGDVGRKLSLGRGCIWSGVLPFWSLEGGKSNKQEEAQVDSTIRAPGHRQFFLPSVSNFCMPLTQRYFAGDMQNTGFQRIP